ncbi:transcription factor AIG1 [Brachypodium distachyon]|uniref:BHLH domain-containing protein n=1 Tax=Brachypodium distachyon TaxID=15368 RepID=A0A0Q3FJR7_BRADI|nr:transcription factor AIG1 [Brachypodium distachyon]KQJ98388.1 hypothetical protein BRADI_3g36610v3 [Brachypodium distachyon]|eukprot:XP_003572226.1 transcription factor AIG1 [Brachypodium distachyon]
MWEGAGAVHGSHEALLLQATGGDRSIDHGQYSSGLLPWQLGPSSAGPSYMIPSAPFGVPESGGSFGDGFADGGGLQLQGQGQHQYGGLFGLEPPTELHGPSSSRMMVSGLLGSLQAELGRMTAKEIMDAKALAASRSHSEAERRRRQRINSHLARLRSLLPNTTKTDKASLLAEVIEHVKELKRQTSAIMAVSSASGEDHAAAPAVQRQLLLPTEADELEVDAAAGEDGRLVVRASLCCEDRPGLIPDVARALAALRLRARRAEIATLGGRVRNVLLITAADEDEEEEGDGGREEEDEDERAGAAGSHRRRHELVASIQEALRGVMDRKGAGASSDTNTTSSSGGGGGGGSSIKRQRVNGAREQGSF